jgi:hypothetical protein
MQTFSMTKILDIRYRSTTNISHAVTNPSRGQLSLMQMMTSKLLLMVECGCGNHFCVDAVTSCFVVVVVVVYRVYDLFADATVVENVVVENIVLDGFVAAAAAIVVVDVVFVYSVVLAF